MMEKENDFPGTQRERQPRVFYVSGFFAQCCVVAVCVMIGLWMGLYSSEPGLGWTNLTHRSHLHPFLMVLAVVFCSTEGKKLDTNDYDLTTVYSSVRDG